MWKLISLPSLSSAESSLVESSPRLESHLWLRASSAPSFFLCLPIRLQLMHAFMCPMYVYMCVCIHARIAKGCITLEVADRYLYSSHDSRYTGSHRTVYRRRDERGFFIKARRSDQNMSLYQPSARFFTLLMAFPDSLRREKKTHCRRIGVLHYFSSAFHPPEKESSSFEK